MNEKKHWQFSVLLSMTIDLVGRMTLKFKSFTSLISCRKAISFDLVLDTYTFSSFPRFLSSYFCSGACCPVRDAVGVVPGDPLRDLPRARPPRPGGPPPHRQHPEKVWDMQIKRIYRNIIHTYQSWSRSRVFLAP